MSGSRCLVGVCVLFVWSVLVSVACAESVPQWSVTAVSRPTNFKPGSGGGGEDVYAVLVANTGGAASSGVVDVTDELPEGVVPAVGVPVVAEDERLAPNGVFARGCGSTGAGGWTCSYAGSVAPGDALVIEFPVKVASEEELRGLSSPMCAVPAGAVGCVRNVVRVSGGGGDAASVVTEATISRAPAGFGVADGGAATVLSSVQAGAHPNITTFGAFNTLEAAGTTAGNLKNIVTYEPPGVGLDLAGTPACQPDLFLQARCPVATQVGVVALSLDLQNEALRELKPVYNLAPEPGQIAKLGFNVGNIRYEGDISVRPPGEAGAYGGRVVFANDTAGIIDVDGFSLTLWGVPASPVNDALRWLPHETAGHFGTSSNASEVAYFTNPTSCSAAALQAEFEVSSWQDPGVSPPRTKMPFGPIVGCDRLLLEPTLTGEVTSDSAYAATGFDFDTTVPQHYENPEVLASAAVRREVVKLPAGVTVNPSSGAGLQACSEQQYAQETTPEKTALEKEEGKGCPNASRLATVRIETPLLSEPAKGSVFLADPAPRGEPGRNPFGSLLAVYLVARIPARGVLVKAPGLIELNGETGQITTSFGLPNALEPAGEELEGGLAPLPFTVAKFEFNQGANAPLVTPAACGEYTVEAQLSSWASPERALEPLVPPFAVDTGCPAGAVPPFAPRVTAYPIHANAGAYSPLYLKIERADGEQEITGFSTQLPPGLTANLSGVQECSEEDVARARAQSGAEAEASPACPAGSEIGRTVAEAGVGSVLAQTPGGLYLGGPYEGAPFSIVSVTAAKVGPFDLGTVVVHLPLDIDPETAVVTIPTGPADQIPHIIKGIVIHLRTIRVYIERPSFMLNPTSCQEAKLSATVIGSGTDVTAPIGSNPVTVSAPFQTADCQALRFEPKFSASTQGHTSKADGASLHVSLTYPAGALTSDANIRYVKVELPRALPSRLTTLQKACTQAQFRASPAGCPSASVIGYAKAKTPILPVPLEGPVYFVSNGGEAFPNLIMVLQGDGVRIDLVGDTYISSSGITSSTFKAVPDQPVESFELTLPEGPYSALGTNKDLCKPTTTKIVKEKAKVRAHGHTRTVTRKVRKTVAEPLTMPTEFVAQNGATFTQTTNIAVTECPKAKAAKKRSKRKRSRKGGK